MWMPPLPVLYLEVDRSSLSCLISTTWAFLCAKPLVRLAKLLRVHAVTWLI